MNDVVPNKAPVMAGWLTLGATWLLFLIPFPGLGLVGWVANLAAFILAIIVMSKGETAQGIGQLVCSLVVSPIVYFIGLVLFVGMLGTMEQM
jgi:Na+/H+ antiporter NhaD/arsenite permease-like protein